MKKLLLSNRYLFTNLFCVFLILHPLCSFGFILDNPRVFEEPLNGTYFIGEGEVFETISTAVETLHQNGVSGPVVLKIKNGFYDEQFAFSEINGVSEISTITLESESGNAEDVIISFAKSGAADNYIVQFSNASNITIKNLHLQSRTAVFSRTVTGFDSNHNITISGCILQSPSRSSTNINRSNVHFDVNNASAIEVADNEIIGGLYGVYFDGGSDFSTGTVIRNNTLSEVHNRGIQVTRSSESVIQHNKIRLGNASPSTSEGLHIQFCDGAIRVIGNEMSNVKGYGLYFRDNHASESQKGLVANNFVSNTGTRTALYIMNSSHQDIVHNNTFNSASARGFYYVGQANLSINNTVVNNIFTSNRGYAIHYGNLIGLEMADYNNLYTKRTALARLVSTDVVDLNLWRELTDYETHSLNLDPDFISSEDLTPQAGVLADKGFDTSPILSDDIFRNPRNLPYSIGAVELTVDVEPLSGEYTIDPQGAGNRNFSSFNAFANALSENGINGPVTAKVADGVYDEQVIFSSIFGSSTVNTITIESASGDPERATLQYPSSNTLTLADVEYFSIKNIGIKTGGVAKVVLVQGRTNRLIFDGNLIESPIAAGSNTNRTGIEINGQQNENTLFINNTIIGGFYGLNFSGSSSSKARGTKVSNNEFRGIHYRSLILDHQDAPEVIDNSFSPTSGASQIAILLSNVESGLLISGNRVLSPGGNALRLQTVSGTPQQPCLIYNNFLYSEGVNRAIYVSNANQLKFYHNSVWNSTRGSVLEYVGSGSNVELINNIFKSNTGYALQINSPNAIAESDHNNLITQGEYLGRWGSTDIPSLTVWQEIAEQDLNSLDVEVGFRSTELLIPSAQSLALTGKDLTNVVGVDIFSIPRITPVSIGAVELDAEGRIPTIGLELISPITSCTLSDNEPLSVKLTNLGAEPLTNLSLGYKMMDMDPVQEPILSDSLLGPGQSFTYTFQSNLNLEEFGTYELSLFTVVEGIESNERNFEVQHFEPMVTTISDNAQICEGSGVTLVATGGVSYEWSNGASGSEIEVFPTSTRTYDVLITDENGCQTEKSVEVEVVPAATLSYSVEAGFLTSYVYPIAGEPGSTFSFMVSYQDPSGEMPESGYPRLEIYDESNLSSPLFDLEMNEIDPNDQDTRNGKNYGVDLAELQDGVKYKFTILAKNSSSCQLNTGMLDGPKVGNDLIDIGIYANDISFSNDNPNVGEPITIFARIRNFSDVAVEDFVVSVYVDEEQIFSEIVDFVRPNSNHTMQWEYAFSYSNFFPVKVVIDETDVLAETNELNNFAIRPLIVGDYELPGGIEVNANLVTTPIYPGSSIRINGNAEYFGIEEGVNPHVAGATVKAQIIGGRSGETNTRSDGKFTLNILAPNEPGTYNIEFEATDYTFSSALTLSFEVVERPPLPDLITAISLNESTILGGGLVTGVASVSNGGNQMAENFSVLIRNCEQTLEEIFIDRLEPGAVMSFPISVSVELITSCLSNSRCVFNIEADTQNAVVESNKVNNKSSSEVKVLAPLPDLTPVRTSIPARVNMLNDIIFRFRIDNVGGVNVVEQFEANVYVNDILIHTESISSLISCGRYEFSVPYTFESVESHVVTIKVDEPIGSGVILEYDEGNNVYTRTITHRPPPPQLPNLQMRVHQLSVDPKLPLSGTSYEIIANFKNDGNAAIEEPFDIDFLFDEELEHTITFDFSIAAGSTERVSFTTDFESSSNKMLKVSLDPSNVILETTTNDNSVEMPLCLDFTPREAGSVWRGNFFVDTQQYLTARIRNLGLFSATDVTVSFYLDDEKIALLVLDELPPSFNTNGRLVRIPYVFEEAGEFLLSVIVDEVDQYSECDKSNNQIERTIRINPPLPDLRVLSEYISPTKLNPEVDEPINIFLSYDNVGKAASESFMARVLVDDRILGDDVPVPALQPGQNGTVAIPTSYFGEEPGAKIIKGILDPENLVTESDKRNNEATRAIIVGDAPNLYFGKIEVDIDCPVQGDQIFITAQVINEGKKATDSRLQFYYYTQIDTIPITSNFISVEALDTISSSITWQFEEEADGIFVEITDSNPQEYNEFDNDIFYEFCGLPQFNLVMNSVGQGFVSQYPLKPSYSLDEEVELVATPAPGWYFFGWDHDFVDQVERVTIKVDSDLEITATFLPVTADDKYKLSYSIEGEGNLEISPDEKEYDAGTSITLEALPKQGWQFMGWDGDLAGSQTPITLQIEKDLNIIAVFIRLPGVGDFNVQSSIVGKGAVELEPEGGSYSQGSLVTIQANPEDGWEFLRWEGGIVGTENPVTATIQSNLNLIAVFEALTYEIVSQVEGEGTVDINPEAESYSYGSEVTLEAIPEAGWEFIRWEGDLEGIQNPLSTTIESDLNAKAVFQLLEYKIQTSVEGEGTLEISPDTEFHTHGSEVTVKANPRIGWEFVRWEGDVEGSQSPLSTTIERDLNITAVFQASQYYIESSVDGEGTIKISPEAGFYIYGSQVTLEAIPQTGWEFIRWEGDIRGSQNPVSTNLDCDLKVTAVFQPSQFYIESSVNGDGTVKISPEADFYTYGSQVSLEAIPQTGWEFIRWEGDIGGSQNPVSTNLDCDLKITAVFQRIRYELDIEVNGDGNVSSEPGDENHEHGSLVQLTAIPAEGWVFARWEGDSDHIEENMAMVLMDKHKSVKVFFVRPLVASFQVDHPSCPGSTDGSINVVPEGGTAPYHFKWKGSVDAGGEALIGLGSGQYDVSITDRDGLSWEMEFELTDMDLLPPVPDLPMLPPMYERVRVDQLLPPTATDICDGTVTAITDTELPITASTTVTWTYTDSSGNSSQQKQEVIIEVEEITVYPNPVTATGFWIAFPPSYRGQRISATLYTVSGKLVTQREFETLATADSIRWDIDHPDWSSGVFTLIISHNQGMEAIKIIK